MAGWWGSGDSSSDSSGSAPKDFSYQEESGYSEGSNMMAQGGGGSGVQEMQQASMALQQQLMVQQVINDLSDRAYEKCVTSKPADSLTGTQAACIKATVNKWLDTNEFMTGRLGKKSQQQQQQSGQY
jgi:hypothetical protein